MCLGNKLLFVMQIDSYFCSYFFFFFLIWVDEHCRKSVHSCTFVRLIKKISWEKGVLSVAELTSTLRFYFPDWLFFFMKCLAPSRKKAAERMATLAITKKSKWNQHNFVSALSTKLLYPTPFLDCSSAVRVLLILTAILMHIC